MSEMSPLAKFLMRILQQGSWAALAFLLLVAAIVVWQGVTPEGTIALTAQDYKFLGVIAFMAALAIYLVRAIGKEINRPGE